MPAGQHASVPAHALAMAVVPGQPVVVVVEVGSALAATTVQLLMRCRGRWLRVDWPGGTVKTLAQQSAICHH